MILHTQYTIPNDVHPTYEIQQPIYGNCMKRNKYIPINGNLENEIKYLY